MTWLTPGGAAAAGLVGAAVVAGLGIRGLWLLLAFFVPASLMTRARGREAREVRGRTARQVWANGGVAALTGLLGWAIPAAGAIAAAAADTWATEIGRRSRRPPRLMTTGREVPPGTSGGVTALGSMAGAAGAVTLGGLYAVLMGASVAAGAAVATAGFLGMLADSGAGATLQARFRCRGCDAEYERRDTPCHDKLVPSRGLAWLDNDAVNVLATLVGAGGAVVLARWWG